MECYNCKVKLTKKEISKNNLSYTKWGAKVPKEEVKYFMCNDCDAECNAARNAYAEHTANSNWS